MPIQQELTWQLASTTDEMFNYIYASLIPQVIRIED